MKTLNGFARIQAERQRQISQEGYDAEHDNDHHVDELASAALAYASCTGPEQPAPANWPWDTQWWKPKDRIRNLERAGALYLAAGDLAARQGLDAASYHQAARRVADDLTSVLTIEHAKHILNWPRQITVMFVSIAVYVMYLIYFVVTGPVEDRTYYSITLGIVVIFMVFAAFDARRHVRRVRARETSQ